VIRRTSSSRGASALTKLASRGYRWIGNGVGRFTVESGRVVGHNGGMGRARTRSGCCGGSVHTVSSCLRALHGMNVETRAIGSKCGVRYWGRDIRNDRLTIDGNWGAWSDTVIWNGV
jgi:hypothetical protein